MQLVGQGIKRQYKAMRVAEERENVEREGQKVLEHKLKSHSLDWLFPLSHRSLWPYIASP